MNGTLEYKENSPWRGYFELGLIIFRCKNSTCPPTVLYTDRKIIKPFVYRRTMCTKLCKYCGEIKKLDCFGNSISTPDGKNFYCKSCRNLKAVKYRATLPKTEKVKVLEKLCKHCGEIKHNSAFGKYSKSKDGLSFYCKSCKVFKQKELVDRRKNKNAYSQKENKFCPSCAQLISSSLFGKCKNTSDGLYHYCKKCSSKKSCNYAKNNKGAVNASCAKRHSRKLKATPKWADLEKIKQIYVNCPLGMVVDHIIPLQGKLVCGLHIHTNLQYLTKSENSIKGNSFEV